MSIKKKVTIYFEKWSKSVDFKIKETYSRKNKRKTRRNGVKRICNSLIHYNFNQLPS